MKKFLLYLMTMVYIAAGINHFWHPGPYMAIMPPWLPAHALLVILSGIAEITLGALLIPVATRHLAAWGIVLLLIAIFPANIQMAANYYHSHDSHLWIALLRLPLQVLLVWWALLYAKKP